MTQLPANIGRVFTTRTAIVATVLSWAFAGVLVATPAAAAATTFVKCGPLPVAAAETTGASTSDTQSARIRLSPSQTLMQLHKTLSLLHTDTLPGPRGEAHRRRQEDALIVSALDVQAFAKHVLVSAWPKASEEDRTRWTATLGRMLHAKYRERLKNPHRHTLIIGDTRWRCEAPKITGKRARQKARKAPVASPVAASVTLRLVPKARPNAKGNALLVHLWRGPKSWRIFDVSVDGTSLMLTWRGRFTSFYRAGGLTSVRRQMTKLAARYDAASRL